ncbi:hypothetical protein [Flavobacterium croceum]|uniref:Uncharacterized protein n=1 Tax=Flavobacterium croceum DSM 17960 TaxID=1121886 RepID=A0A2S4N5Q1_9FLAO|nr:hypothetical protein [Flavobacterium croceum]POS01006.1 hypothetical protein Q361_11512 [Flavobacterium croceum DSM 17960]
MNIDVVKTVVIFGTILAITISWSLNKSIFWAIFHGFCGWLYIIYYAIGSPNNDDIDK